MASGVEVLRFQLPGHEAATLRNMNQLRAEERFCDVTIVADSLKFRGHKVILAACSPFLRDQNSTARPLRRTCWRPAWLRSTSSSAN
uniref:BTB domain-containing protein n=1 Tax=Spermophilus dauricus TaxID=99837 RepID=A0A8C9P7U2_SPEDA